LTRDIPANAGGWLLSRLLIVDPSASFAGRDVGKKLSSKNSPVSASAFERVAQVFRPFACFAAKKVLKTKAFATLLA
jgi:hypothetical protein